MALPSIRAVGTEVSAASGNLTPTIPTHQADDILLAFVEHTVNSDITTATSGWAELTDSPQGTVNVRKEVWWKRATSSSETDPTFTGFTDQGMVVVISVQDCIASGSPFEDTAGTTDTGLDGKATLPALTTAVNDCLVFYGVAYARDFASTTNFSAWTSADLANITERFDKTVADGGGGGIGIVTGEKTVAGSIAAGEVTLAVTSGAAIIGFALKGAAVSFIPRIMVI